MPHTYTRDVPRRTLALRRVGYALTRCGNRFRWSCAHPGCREDDQPATFFTQAEAITAARAHVAQSHPVNP